mmetsp:Transcript_4848/g.19402  ORF Transcript_4848/g.19402 Transcript_4848/m.19402 type:complete len:242 (-) Transcript_4848:34-759(-)
MVCLPRDHGQRDLSAQGPEVGEAKQEGRAEAAGRPAVGGDDGVPPRHRLWGDAPPREDEPHPGRADVSCHDHRVRPRRPRLQSRCRSAPVGHETCRDHAERRDLRAVYPIGGVSRSTGQRRGGAGLLADDEQADLAGSKLRDPRCMGTPVPQRLSPAGQRRASPALAQRDLHQIWKLWAGVQSDHDRPDRGLVPGLFQRLLGHGACVHKHQLRAHGAEGAGGEFVVSAGQASRPAAPVDHP